ncbi:response regulator transcription factor [Bacillus sp. FJAT-44742]|uniref:response regulator transcription factor n=1 Tax=Bacillus sp. FJAT-44742 TaxID=2014005 RepID=UPI0018E23DB6|nr:LuxR C-terminal-related transcriptional regulator [Bacillus sp. FJAT-44742]
MTERLMGKEGKRHMIPANYMFVEEKDFAVYHQVLINKRETIQNDERFTTEKELKIHLIPYYPRKLPRLVAQLKEDNKQAHMSVVLSAPDFPFIKKLIKMDVFHFYSNVHSGDALFQLWKETHAWLSFVDVPFQKCLKDIAKELVQWNNFSQRYDPVMDPNEGMYQLIVEEESVKSYLTYSETLVVQKVVKGKTNIQIAEDLYVSVSTVNNHVSHILHKLSVRNKAQLLKRLIEMKLVTLVETPKPQRS